MKNECNIITDLIPLYVEDMVSEDTKVFVEEHIYQCENCQKQLEKLQSDTPIRNGQSEIENPVKVMKKIEKKISEKRVYTGAISALVSAVIIILAFAYLTAPEYQPYSDELGSVSVQETDGTVALSLTGEYQLSQREPGVYDVSIYNTMWNELFDQTQTQTIIINPNGEEVNTVYYVSNGEIEDVVLYTKDQMVGSVLTLPRLILNYYLILAILMAVGLLILLMIVRKNPKYKKMRIQLLLAPLDYIIASIMVTGINATTYNSTRDSYLILLITILLYILSFFTYRRIKSFE